MTKAENRRLKVSMLTLTDKRPMTKVPHKRGKSTTDLRIPHLHKERNCLATKKVNKVWQELMIIQSWYYHI